MRLATFALLLVAIALVAVGLNLLEISEPWLTATAMVVVPMTWVLAGIALTGMPTLVFVAANLVMQLRGLAALDRSAAPMPWFIGAGALLGIAIAGRQTTSVLAVTPLLLPLIDRRLLVPVLVQAAIAALMALITVALGAGAAFALLVVVNVADNLLLSLIACVALPLGALLLQSEIAVRLVRAGYRRRGMREGY